MKVVSTRMIDPKDLPEEAYGWLNSVEETKESPVERRRRKVRENVRRHRLKIKNQKRS